MFLTHGRKHVNDNKDFFPTAPRTKIHWTAPEAWITRTANSQLRRRYTIRVVQARVDRSREGNASPATRSCRHRTRSYPTTTSTCPIRQSYSSDYWRGKYANKGSRVDRCRIVHRNRTVIRPLTAATTEPRDSKPTRRIGNTVGQRLDRDHGEQLRSTPRRLSSPFLFFLPLIFVFCIPTVGINCKMYTNRSSRSSNPLRFLLKDNLRVKRDIEETFIAFINNEYSVFSTGYRDSRSMNVS